MYSVVLKSETEWYAANALAFLINRFRSFQKYREFYIRGESYVGQLDTQQ